MSLSSSLVAAGRIEVLSGGYRRRKWAPQEKARITQESFCPGARIAEVSRRHGLSEGLLYQWRKTARESGGGQPMFIPVQVEDRQVKATTALTSM